MLRTDTSESDTQNSGRDAYVCLVLVNGKNNNSRITLSSCLDSARCNLQWRNGTMSYSWMKGETAIRVRFFPHSVNSNSSLPKFKNKNFITPAVFSLAHQTFRLVTSANPAQNSTFLWFCCLKLCEYWFIGQWTSECLLRTSSNPSIQ
jgi:hypothetical protein